MSHSLLHDLITRHLHASEAVRTTQHCRKALNEEALAKAAAPHVEKMIAEIEKSATSGRGQCHFTFDTDRAEVMAFACDYIRMTGYKVELVSEGLEGAGSSVLIRWLD